jgi:hypothetical protein
VEGIERRLGEIDQMAYELAQDIASGRVELDLPDEPRPLFDRPSKPVVEIAPPVEVEVEILIDPPVRQFPKGTTIPFPVGARLFQCGRCNLLRRPEDGHPCGHCRCPEFALVQVEAGNRIACGWPEEPEAVEESHYTPTKRADWRAMNLAYLDIKTGQAMAMEEAGIDTCGKLWEAITMGKLVGMCKPPWKITVDEAEEIEELLIDHRARHLDPVGRPADPTKIRAARVKAEAAGHAPRKPRRKKEAAVE